MSAADETPGIDICAMGHGASVEYDEIGRSGIADGEVALVSKRGFDGGAVRLGRTAAETLDEDTLHTSSLLSSPRFAIQVNGSLGPGLVRIARVHRRQRAGNDSVRLFKVNRIRYELPAETAIKRNQRRPAE